MVFLAFFDFVVLLLDLGRDTPGKRAKRAFSNVDRNRQPCWEKKKTEEQPNRKKPSIEDHSCQRSPSVMGEFCWPDPTQIAKKKDAFQSNKLASPTHLFFYFFTLTKRTSLPPVDRLCVSTKDCIGKIRNDGEELSVTLVLFFFLFPSIAFCCFTSCI